MEFERMDDVEAAQPKKSGGNYGARRKSFFFEKFDTLNISWDTINYSVDVRANRRAKAEKRQVINNVNGLVLEGQMCAIMGPSGAGKSTMLDILARRVSGYTGSVLVNGQWISTKMFRRATGYVTQHDLVMPTMSVRETLMFYALLKMPKSVSLEDKYSRVDDLIEELGLTPVAESKVGNDQIRGLSGGERRRVSIAIELITKPSILFLDEPTSGLDSFTSLSIMEVMKQLCNSGRTILCTIHQPRADIFMRFDLLMLLARGGGVVYFGPTKSVISYFEKLGHGLPEGTNPADFVVDLITYTSATSNVDVPSLTPEQVAALREKYFQSAEYQQLKTNLVTFKEKAGKLPEDLTVSERFPSGLEQFWILLKRNLVNIGRDRLQSRAKLVQMSFLALLQGLVFYQLDYSQSALQGRQGVLMFSVVAAALNMAVGVVQVFPAEKHIVLRERKGKTYSMGVFFLAKSVADMPMLMILPFWFGTILYWMTNLKATAGAFFQFLIVLFLIFNIAHAFGMMISTAVPNTAIGTIVTPPLLVIQLLFAGFFIRFEDIPPALRWMSEISIIRWGFEALVVNEFTGKVFTCDKTILTEIAPCSPLQVCDLPVFDENGVDADGNRCLDTCTPCDDTNLALCPTGASACRVPNGDILLSQLGMTSDYGEAVLVLLALYWAYKLLGYYVLKRLDAKHMPKGPSEGNKSLRDRLLKR